MARTVRHVVSKWGYIVAISLLACGIIVMAIVLLNLGNQQDTFAQDGRLARARQIRLMPVACKEHTDAFERGVITAADLKLTGCP